MLNIYNSTILILIIFYTIYILNKIYLDYNKLDKKELKSNIMATILILFGILKLYDIHKFSNIFQKYDLISKILPIYSYIYPFLEIFLGLNLILKKNLIMTKIITKNIMLISIVSILISLYNGENLRSGCIGTFFNVPLSYISISENLLMLYLMM